MQLELIKDRIFKVLDSLLYRISSISFEDTNVILVCNSVMSSISMFISIQLRIGMDFFSSSYLLLFNNVFVFGLVSASVFVWFKVNIQSLHYNDINKLLLSVLVSNFTFVPLLYLMNWTSDVPFAVILINIFVMSVLLLGLRYVYFILFSAREYTLLIGNRNSISVFLNSQNNVIYEFLNNIGVINTNPDIPIYIKNKIQVIGNIMDLSYIISRTNIKQVIIIDSNLQDDYKDLLFKLSKQHKFLLVQTCTSINK